MTQPPIWILAWTERGGFERRSARLFRQGDPIWTDEEGRTSKDCKRLALGYRTYMVSAWTEEEAWADMEAMVARDRGLATDPGSE
jgi:hypothetical protein